MEDQLDKVKFTCCQCKEEFSHIDGTWLPIGEGYALLGATVETINATVFALHHRPPEIITSDQFTCYNCL